MSRYDGPRSGKSTSRIDSSGSRTTSRSVRPSGFTNASSITLGGISCANGRDGRATTSAIAPSAARESRERMGTGIVGRVYRATAPLSSRKRTVGRRDVAWCHATVPAATLSHKRPHPTAMQSLLDDLRFAFRMVARRRRFAGLLVATIALGIGAATSIFSLVDIALWKPLPYQDANRLFWIARTDESWRASPVLASVWNNMGHALPDYHQWATVQRSFEATGAWFATTGVLRTNDGLEQL